MLNWGREKFGTGAYNEASYRGTVIDNNDPDKNHRIKVRILDIHRGVEDEDIPWALPKTLGGGNTDVTGNVDVPPLGAMVNIEFLDDDPYHPVYSGGSFHKNTQLPELVEDYPNTKGRVFENGAVWKMNINKDTLTLTHPSGTSVEIDGAGHIKLAVADNTVGPNAEATLPAGVTIEIQGSAKIIAKEDIELTAKRDIKLWAGRDVSIQSVRNQSSSGLTRFQTTGGTPAPSPTEPDEPNPRDRPNIQVPNFDSEKVDGGPVGIMESIDE